MNLNIQFDTITCCECGFLFAVPHDVKDRWVNYHTYFRCPSCGTSQRYAGKSHEEKLKDKVWEYKAAYEEKLKCCLNLQDEVYHQQNQINGYKGAIKKIKNKRGD